MFPPWRWSGNTTAPSLYQDLPPAPRPPAHVQTCRETKDALRLGLEPSVERWLARLPWHRLVLHPLSPPHPPPRQSGNCSQSRATQRNHTSASQSKVKGSRGIATGHVVTAVPAPFLHLIPPIKTAPVTQCAGRMEVTCPERPAFAPPPQFPRASLAAGHMVRVGVRGPL